MVVEEPYASFHAQPRCAMGLSNVPVGASGVFTSTRMPHIKRHHFIMPTKLSFCVYDRLDVPHYQCSVVDCRKLLSGIGIHNKYKCYSENDRPPVPGKYGFVNAWYGKEAVKVEPETVLVDTDDDEERSDGNNGPPLLSRLPGDRAR